MSMIVTVTTLMAASITLALLSYLWRENLGFRIAEHAFVGASAGYGALILAHSAWQLLQPFLAKGEWWWYLTIVLGLMYPFFFSKKMFWLYRYPTAIVLGGLIGVFVARSIKTQLIDMIRDTGVVTNVNGAIVAVGVICGLFYFYATREHTGSLRYVSKIGVYFLMAAFGASFGVTVMARISLLIGRLRFLYFTDPAYYMIPVAIVLLIVFIIWERVKKKS